MEHRRGERGDGKISFLITLAVFGVLVFVAIKVLPVRINAYQFRESLREEARYASVNRDDRLVAQRILEQASELEIPLSREDVNIRRTKSEVIITASFEQPIDLKFTTYTYKFNAEQRAPTF